MNRDEKAAVIEQVAQEIGASEAIFAVDYRGITVAQIGDLRGKLRESDTTLRVVKNSLSERAAEQAGAAGLKPLLTGPTALALVKGDPAAAAKALSDAAKALHGPLQFKGGFMNGAALSGDDVQAIAKLPSRDVLYGQLVGTVAAPLSGLVRTLNALISGLALQLGQIAEQGLVSGTATDATTEAAGDEATPAAVTEDGAAVGVNELAEGGSGTAAEAPADEPDTVAEATTETEGVSDDSPSDL